MALRGSPFFEPEARQKFSILVPPLMKALQSKGGLALAHRWPKMNECVGAEVFEWPDVLVADDFVAVLIHVPQRLSQFTVVDIPASENLPFGEMFEVAGLQFGSLKSFESDDNSGREALPPLQILK